MNPNGVPQIGVRCLFIDFLLLKVPPNCHFEPIRGAAKFIQRSEGCREPKKVEKHCIREYKCKTLDKKRALPGPQNFSS